MSEAQSSLVSGKYTVDRAVSLSAGAVPSLPVVSIGVSQPVKLTTYFKLMLKDRTSFDSWSLSKPKRKP